MLINIEIFYYLKIILKRLKNNFPIFNVGTGKNISMKNHARLIKKIIGYNGEIRFNSFYPDGTKKKNLNSSRIKILGWKPKIKLEEGIKKILEQKKFKNE